MFKAVVIALICAIAVPTLILAENLDIYPDWNCHEAFKNNEEGQSFFKQTMGHCENAKVNNLPSPLSCKKSCMLMLLQIMNDKEFMPESEISNGFRHRIFGGNDDATAERIAKNIVSDCSSILKDVSDKNLPCSEWKELYSCVWKAWA